MMWLSYKQKVPISTLLINSLRADGNVDSAIWFDNPTYNWRVEVHFAKNKGSTHVG